MVTLAKPSNSTCPLELNEWFLTLWSLGSGKHRTSFALFAITLNLIQTGKQRHRDGGAWK